jgi:hypothetical protein
MTRRRYAFLTGVIGSAITAWWWTRNQRSSMRTAPRERGRVIFDNTPVA